jgi:drug/metabolite transporter (DMT)-like permease
MNRPLLLLLGTGVMLGLNFPLGKLAIASGVEPALWAALISLGAGVALFIVSSLAGRGATAGGPVLKYAIVSGFLSYVVPNFLTFSAIPKIGSGLAAIMSPVLTAALSILLKVRPPSAVGLLGIALGLFGALVIIVFRGASFSVGSVFWLAAALLIPVFLGVGNIYRTLAWPEGARPRKLAAVTNLAAVPPLLLIAFAQTGTLDIAPLAAVPGLAALQVAVSTLMFLMFFRLQQLGGPTYLSQIGYVAAAVGVAIGVTWLGETYPAGVWVGAGIIAAGIAVSTFAQLRQG